MISLLPELVLASDDPHVNNIVIEIKNDDNNIVVFTLLSRATTIHTFFDLKKKKN